MKKILPLFFAGLMASSAAIAKESFTVNKIDIKGLDRISLGTVLTYLPVKIGDTVDRDKSTLIISKLYQTGFFKDIRVEQENGTLVVRVLERPTISNLVISGNKDIPDDDLLQGLRDAGFAKGRPFNPVTLDKIEGELERQYHSFGKYGVEIKVTTTEDTNNRVAIVINIHEGDIARIRSINVIGNKAFSDKKLLAEFKLSKPHLLSWFTKSDQYSKQKFNADLETLRSYYLDRGYINFNITSTNVAISADKKDVFLTISVEEGERYTFGKVELTGEFIIPKSELEQLITIKPGSIFSRRQLTEDAEAMADKLGDHGYAFSNINPMPEIDEENKVVDLVIMITPGERVNVRRIDFMGNSKTKDEVLRRSVTQLEGSWLSTTKVKDSRTNLNRIGYVKNAKIETRPVPNTTDQVDLLFSVEEAPSGSVQGGIGYSDSDGFLINASVSNRNFLGTGNSLELEFNNSSAYTTYSLAYNNPFVTPNGISRGFSIFYNETDLSNVSSITSYATDSYGASVSYGIPMSSKARITAGFGVQRTELSVDQSQAPIEIVDFIGTNGSSHDEATLSVGWKYNSLDKYLLPTFGMQHSLGLSITVPGSDLHYFRVRYNNKIYIPLGRDFIFATKADVGYGDGYGKTDELPFYQHFFAGGSRTVRGYSENSLGPKDSLGRPFGGNLLVAASAAIILPNFFNPENDSIRISLFVDAGQVYDLNNPDNASGVNRNPNGLRYSAGISVIWVSPVAPLEFSLTQALNAQQGDDEDLFTFSFGTFF